MKSKPHPSQERLHELFEYCEDNISQPLVWKIIPSRSMKIGDVAGRLHSGTQYYLIQINKKQYRLHRLVWIYHNGDIPNEMIVDHIDGDTKNNRIENLRLATHSENLRNSKIRSTNTSGIKGVQWYKSRNKWRAQIRVDNKEKFLGYFDTIEEAETVAIAARNNIHGDFARHE
jgi:hypothetical protein